ncbi:unnamed protein product [Caenorhabditis bovis]|uniref:Thioredoxin domain-containing protein n=1 Tax=Caenorhabditis bovis TaxID=2654633 RepID=A0A8S1F4E5_9PELO|nr:unnamed protein product [Caenorhabditis bovis]
MKLGDTLPNFSLSTDRGKIDRLYEWIGNDSWLMICSHPADFTPVCTTELAKLAELAPEFAKRNVKILAVSIDSAETHRQWAKDILGYSQKGSGDAPSSNLPYEIIADEDRSICTSLGMIDPDEINSKGIALSARAVLLFGPDRKLKSQILYPATFGRNFDEILRMVDGVQLGASAAIATPVNWRKGDAVIAQPSLKMDQVVHQLCDGDASLCETVALPSGKEYLRIIHSEKFKK